MPQANNLLFAVKVKKTVKVDVKGPIMKYIRNVYGDHMASEAEDSLDTIQDLRNQIFAASSSVAGIGMEPFAKYLHALQAIELRFPVTTDSSQVNITFKWHDSFVEAQACSQKNIHFEKASVLFCMAAIASQRGIDVSRETEAGISEANKAFREAAGLLKYLRENVTIKTDVPRSTDITGECCSMLEQLMLAQAQEVFYEALHKKRAGGASKISHGTLAAVAAACSSMYGAVSALYRKPALVKHFTKEWGESSRVKAILYHAEAHMLMGQQYRLSNGQEQGLLLAHLRKAATHLKEHRKEVKLASEGLQAHVKELEVYTDKLLEEAEKDNRSIYMQTVPHSAPDPDGKVMVSSKDPADLFTRSEEWFEGIVPDKVTRNLSKYTGQMEGLVRDLLAKLEGATDDARLALVSHGLPDVLDAMNPGKKPELPEKARVALMDDFVTHGPASLLRTNLQNLETLKAQTNAELRHCIDILDEEERCDNNMRRTWGEAWTRPLSSVLTATLRETVARYQANLKTAADSDARVAARLREKQTRLESLSVGAARAAMPTLQAPMVTTGCADPATVTNTLRQALAALDGLALERAALEERVKRVRDEDNILPTLLRSGAEATDAVFRQHLDKYGAFAAEVDTNVGRQAELLAVLHHNMGAFKTVYDVEGWRQECDRIADGIRHDVTSGNELLSQLKEGVLWYSGMQDSVKKLTQMCADFVMTRTIDQEERDQALAQRSDKDRAIQANEDAARRLQEMDIAGRGSGAGHPAQQPPGPSPAPPHGTYPHAPAPAPPAPHTQGPYAAYPAPAAPVQPDFRYQQPPPPQPDNPYPPGNPYGAAPPAYHQAYAPPHQAYGHQAYGHQPYGHHPYGQPGQGQPPQPPPQHGHPPYPPPGRG